MAHVQVPDTLLVEASASLYNAVGAADLPAASGDPHGLDAGVAAALIALMTARLPAIGIPAPANGNLGGYCIYASAVAAKFMRHRAHFYSSNVVCIGGASDHYFVVARRGDGDPVICDITCSQFQGPAFIVGTLGQTAARANGLQAVGTTLQACYALGAEARNFVI